MDAFLEDPGLLEGQPKRVIGDYVESNGILVPRRFASLEETRESGLDYIVRSEHEIEYAGPSGLFESKVVLPGDSLDLDGKFSDSQQAEVDKFCELAEVAQEEEWKMLMEGGQVNMSFDYKIISDGRAAYVQRL